MKILEGYRTYTGLVIVLLGILGVSQYITEAEVSQVIDLILQLTGIAVAVYGRAVTKGN